MSVYTTPYEIAEANKGDRGQPCSGLITSPLPKASTPGHDQYRDIRLTPDDWEYRIRCREDFDFLPRLAGGTILFHINGTFSDAEVAKALLANRNWEVQGTNMTNALVTRSTGGSLIFTTAGASADQAIIAPLQEATVKADGGSGATYDSRVSKIAWSSGLRPWFRCLIKTDATDILQQIIWAGMKLTSTATVATDDDQFFFRVASGASAGTFHAISSNAGTDEDTDLGSLTTLAAATTYLLEILVDANGYPYFYINKKFYKKGAQLKTTITSYLPFIGIQASEAVAKNLTIRWIDVSQDHYSGATTGIPGIAPGGAT